MSAMIFDTLDYSNKLRAVGVSREQAEVQAHAIADLIDDKLATKHDLIELEERLTYKLTIRLGSMIIAAVSALAILIKIL